MKQHLRLLVFLIFACTFFASASTIVLYTLGYRFSAERGVFIYTGSITVKSNPAVVTISIDGKPNDPNANRLNNTYHINGLQPGEHFIEISAPGYTTWSKKTTISSGLSSEFWNVILTKEDYPITTYSAQSIDKAFPSPTSTLFAYVTKNEKGFSVSAIDTDSNETNSVFSVEDYDFNTEDRENIEWSVDSQYLSVPAIQGDQKNYFIVNTDTKEVINLNEITSLDNPHSVRWDSSRNNVLFAISENVLYEIPLIAPEQKRILADNIQSYDISGNDIYFIEMPNALVYKTAITNTDTRTQITTSPLTDLSDTRYSLIAYDESRIILINYFTGQLFIYNKGEHGVYFTQLSHESKGAQFSDDGKKLLYWTDREIFVYFTRDWKTQPLRSENSLMNIGRFSQVIKNIHWSEDYEHATLSVGPYVKLIELDNRGERSIFDIIKLPGEPSQILSNFAEDMLFYTLGQDGNQKNNMLYSFEFPEDISRFLPFNN